jgi:hypothetical protein
MPADRRIIMAYQIEIHGLRATVASGGQLVVTGESAALTPAEAQAFAKLLKTLAGLAPGLYLPGTAAKPAETAAPAGAAKAAEPAKVAIQAPEPMAAPEATAAVEPTQAAAPAKAPEPAAVPATAAAEPATAKQAKAKAADTLPGRPRSIPRKASDDTAAPKAISKAKDQPAAAPKGESAAPKAADGLPGRPRSIPRVAGTSAAPAAPAAKAAAKASAPAAAAAPAAKGDNLPGRPRSTPRTGTSAGTSTAAGPEAVEAAPQAKRGPGRPRRERADPSYVGPIVSFVTTLAPERKRGGRPKGSKNREKESESAATPEPTAAPVAKAAAATPATPAVAEAPAPKSVKPTGPKGPRLIDLYDAWMRENPGLHGRLDLIKLGVEKGWLVSDDAARSFGISMSRERELFHHDKVTDQWIRRAELKAPITKGRYFRRPRDGQGQEIDTGKK